MFNRKHILIVSILVVAGIVMAFGNEEDSSRDCTFSDGVACVCHDFMSESVSHKGTSSIQKFGNCGIMAEIIVSVSTSDQVTVTGNGAGGAQCTWQNMEVQVQLRNASTGLWESQPGYDGSGTTWTDDFDGTGYDKYRAKTTSLDSLVGNGDDEVLHRVTTGWLKGAI